MKLSFEATDQFEESRRKHARLKRALRKGNITEHVTELIRGQCGRPCDFLGFVTLNFIQQKKLTKQ